MPPDYHSPHLQIMLRGKEDDYPPLLDVSAFLYDFNLLYEFARIAIDPNYSNYTFSREYSWNRKNRPLSGSDRLLVDRLQHESPILLIAAVAAVPAAVAAVWGIVQTVEKISNWTVNRDILRLQRDKLREEVAKLQVAPQQLPDEQSFRLQLEKREAIYFFDRTEQRLRESSIQITEIEVRVLPQLPPKKL
jgi:hypothetical protein